jgi:hypothetical protein
MKHLVPSRNGYRGARDGRRRQFPAEKLVDGRRVDLGRHAVG